MPVKGYTVAASSELSDAAAAGMALVEMGYRINDAGRLIKQAVLSPVSAELMGISDAAMTRLPEDIRRLAGDIFYEMKSRNYKGVLLDFEGSGESMMRFASRLSHALADRGVRHFLPGRFFSAAPSAVLLLQTAVSGGSFSGMCAEMERRYGAGRVAYELEPARQDFTLPSMGAPGKKLTPEALRRMISDRAYSVFYSRELACRYFTYRDEEGKTHFVIYDDRDTVAEKMRLIGERGDFEVFILFSDWRTLG